jgi:hypothetical protein
MKVERPADSYAVALFEILFNDTRCLVKAGYANPSGLLFSGAKGKIQTRNRLTFRIVKDFGVIA